MAADLHVHTTFSDGEDTPQEVVAKAKEARLKTIAITDHDVVDGIEPAISEGERLSVTVIPGVEFTTELPKKEVHILGYFIDYKRKDFNETLSKIRESRQTRIYRIAEKLKKIGITLDPKKVFAISGSGSAGRPHVARALLEDGIVKSVREAFHKYLSSRGPAYVPHYKLSPTAAVKLVLSCGGIPVFAHPAISNCDDIIPDLVAAGLKGIEVYYPSHSERDVKRYLGFAKKMNLLVTGGSDYHGVEFVRDVKLGAISIPDDLVKKLFEAKEELDEK